MERKITSSDVAKEAGVSQSLVSLILNNAQGKKIKKETRENVLQVAQKLGYRANFNARSMKSRSAFAIGILSSWDENTFVFPPVINGVKRVCAENDLGVVICSGIKSELGNYDFVDYYLQNRIDGLVYISYVGVKADGVIEALLKANIPFVCVIGARDIAQVSCVDINFVENGHMAVKHLAENGYRNIAYLERDGELNYAEIERIEGANKAAEENNISITFINSLIDITGEENLIREADRIISLGIYDSVISTSYDCFIFLKAAAKKGIKVPQDLGVISLDNELYAKYLYPSLTTVDEPLFESAIKACEILLDKIGGKIECEKYELSPLISIRESTIKNKKGLLQNE